MPKERWLTTRILPREDACSGPLAKWSLAFAAVRRFFGASQDSYLRTSFLARSKLSRVPSEAPQPCVRINPQVTRRIAVGTASAVNKTSTTSERFRCRIRSFASVPSGKGMTLEYSTIARVQIMPPMDEQEKATSDGRYGNNSECRRRNPSAFVR